MHKAAVAKLSATNCRIKAGLMVILYYFFARRFRLLSERGSRQMMITSKNCFQFAVVCAFWCATRRVFYKKKKIKYLERCKFFPIKFAVRVEVRLTLWAETNIVKLRRYVTCKLHQSSLVTQMVSANLSDLMKPVVPE